MTTRPPPEQARAYAEALVVQRLIDNLLQGAKSGLIANREITLTAAAKTIRALQSSLAEKDETIARLQLEISTYDSCEQLTEIAELRARCEAAERDAERLRQFERWADDGFCPHLVFDDDGHWAVSFAGSGPCAQSDETTSHVAVVEPHEWRDSVGEAIDAALAAQYAAQRKEGGL